VYLKNSKSNYNNLRVMHVAQFGPVYPLGHWHVYEQEYWLAIHNPLFKHGLELHGLLSIF